jgi:hypothetical protein
VTSRLGTVKALTFFYSATAHALLEEVGRMSFLFTTTHVVCRTLAGAGMNSLLSYIEKATQAKYDTVWSPL